VVEVPASGGKGRLAKDAVPGANYSIDTVKRLKESLKKNDRVFFLIGMDRLRRDRALASGRGVISRMRNSSWPAVGLLLADVANALPEKIRPPRKRKPALR
jgi:hypothetical protein